MKTFKIMVIVLLAMLVLPSFAQEQQDAAAKKALEIQKKIKVKLYNVAIKEGLEAVKDKYSKLKSEYAETFDFTPALLNSLGDSLLGDQKLKEAIDIFTLNLELYQETLPIVQRIKLAALTANKNLLQKVEETIKQLNSDSLATYEVPINFLGYQLLGLDLDDAAITVFMLNQRLFPKSINTYDSLGWALMKADRKDEALTFFKEALTLKPDFSSALRVIQIVEGKQATAEKDLKADEIIKRHVDAIGGEAKLRAITTKKMVGHVETTRGNKFTDVRYYKRPNWFRAEQFNAITVSDGNKIWNVTADGWREYPIGQRMGIIYHAEFDGGFLDYRENGISYIFIGEDTLAGKKVNILRMTYKDGAKHDLYFDKETGLHTMTKWSRCNGAYVNRWFSDYKEVGGVLMPHQIKYVFDNGGEFTRYFEKITINEPLDDALFKPDTGN